jgi:hypothetical protein
MHLPRLPTLLLVGAALLLAASSAAHVVRAPQLISKMADTAGDGGYDGPAIGSIAKVEWPELVGIGECVGR